MKSIIKYNYADQLTPEFMFCADLLPCFELKKNKVLLRKVKQYIMPIQRSLKQSPIAPELIV